jgi:hypothetical protein
MGQTAELTARALNWYTKRVARQNGWDGVVVVGPEVDPVARSYRAGFNYFDPEAPELGRLELAALLVEVPAGVWSGRLKCTRGEYSFERRERLG